jgi:hypothetical protein
MFAFVCLPPASLWLHPNGLTATLIAVLSAMVLFAHRKNLVEEIAGLSSRRNAGPKPESPKL